jgi:hypothetical protein
VCSSGKSVRESAAEVPKKYSHNDGISEEKRRKGFIWIAGSCKMSCRRDEPGGTERSTAKWEFLTVKRPLSGLGC